MRSSTHDARTPHRWWVMLATAVLASALTLAGVWLFERVTALRSSGDRSAPSAPNDSIENAPGPDNTHTTLPPAPEPA